MVKKSANPPRPNTILVVSKDAKLADIRAHVLEEAGYRVISAGNLLDMRKACGESKIDLMVIGYSLPLKEKRRVWVEAKEFCHAPILELYEDGRHELVETSRLFTHESLTPTDFLATVNFILKGPGSAALKSG